MMQEENFMIIPIQVYWYRISEQMYFMIPIATFTDYFSMIELEKFMLDNNN